MRSMEFKRWGNSTKEVNVACCHIGNMRLKKDFADRALHMS
jgi:hypothetical protein